MWAASATGCLLVVVGAIWLLALGFGDEGATAAASGDRAAPAATSGSSAPAPPPPEQPTQPTSAEPLGTSWTETILLDTDLGTGSREFSAVTVNESTNRVMVADDAGWLYEFDLTSEGEPVIPPRRAWRVTLGTGDIEGLAWMFDSTYVLAHENDGRLTVVEIDDSVETVGAQHLVRTIDTGIRETNGNGLEGVTYIADPDDAVEFVVAQERPPALRLIDRAGNEIQRVPIRLGLSDLSDVWADSAGNFHLVSDEGRVVVTVAIDSSGEITTLDTLSLTTAAGRFEQAEGVVGTTDGTRLFVVGEAPGVGGFSFGMWTAVSAN